MRQFLLTTIMLCITICTFAQQHKERVKALKVAFITERLDLSSEEAQQFWPVYNAFEKERETLRRTLQSKRLGLNIENMTDEDAKILIKNMLALEAKKHELHQKHINQLLGVLPPKKVIKLMAAEEAFKKRIIREMQNRRKKFNRN